MQIGTTWQNRMRNLSITTWLVTGVLGLVVFFMQPVSASNLTIGGPSDRNDGNAVVNGGVHSVSAITAAYNSDACVREIFGSFGISRADINNLPNTAVAGTVTKSGDVFAGGRLVARNATTGGHQNMSGSTSVSLGDPSCKLFKRPPSVSFVSSPLPAFVSMENDRFQFAIIASCGNAVMATPTTPPHKAAVAPARPIKSRPAPTTPAPSQTQTQTQAQQMSQSQSVTVQTAGETTPAPAPAPAPTPSPAAPSTAPAAAPLPNTGPGDVLGLFALSGLAGFLGYRRFLLHRL